MELPSGEKEVASEHLVVTVALVVVALETEEMHSRRGQLTVLAVMLYNLVLLLADLVTTVVTDGLKVLKTLAVAVVELVLRVETVLVISAETAVTVEAPL